MTARWRGHAHPELYNMINAGPGAGASHAQTQYWASLTEELAAVDADLNKALTNMKASWNGSAADSADSSMTPLQRWASDAQSGSSVMRVSSEDQAQFVSTARAEMPKPVPVTTPEPSAWQMVTAGAAALTGNPGPAAMVAMQAVDNEMQEAAQDAAAQKAVDTMQSYESNSEWNRNTLGTFVAPPDVVIDTPPPRGDGTGTGATVGGWNGSAGNFSSSNTTATGYITTPPSTGGGGGGTPPPAPGGGGGGTPPPGGAPVGTLPGGNATGNNSGTDPSYVQPSPTPPPPPAPHPTPTPPTHGGTGPFPGGGGPYWNGGGDRSYLPNNPNNNPFVTGDSSGRGAGGNNPPGGRGPGGPGGAGGLGGLPGGAADADGGRSAAQLGRGAGAMGVLPGGGAEGVAGGRGGAQGGAGAGGRGGAGMAGGPMGAGGRGTGDEDDEHFSPDYLLETTDVFGDERMVSPAVIGENPNVEEK